MTDQRMKLNGWIRLWIVFSVCWFTLIGYLAYADLSPIYTKKTYKLSREGIGRVEFVFSSAQSDAEIKDQITNELIPLVEATPKDYVDKHISTPYEKYLEKHLSAEFRKYVKIALFPVFISLALGWSLIWVRRGFKEKANV